MGQKGDADIKADVPWQQPGGLRFCAARRIHAKRRTLRRDIIERDEACHGRALVHALVQQIAQQLGRTDAAERTPDRCASQTAHACTVKALLQRTLFQTVGDHRVPQCIPPDARHAVIADAVEKQRRGRCDPCLPLTEPHPRRRSAGRFRRVDRAFLRKQHQHDLLNRVFIAVIF